ncbi:hypothetical protein TNCV_1444441 [Trichonephila clavipes]|nr:hypothetical protein TNCV_1444441 [Trichonephila clavipes]
MHIQPYINLSGRGSLVMVVHSWLSCYQFEHVSQETRHVEGFMYIESQINLSSHGSLVVKVVHSWPSCHELEPQCPGDTPCGEAHTH